MAGIGGIIGSVIGGLGSTFNSNSTNSGYSASQTNVDRQETFAREMMAQQQAFNSAEAAKSREWSEMMRKTAYQTTMEDMKKAGLNPILAASRGATSADTGAAAAAGLPGIGAESESYGANSGMSSAESYSNFANALQELGSAAQSIASTGFGIGGNKVGNTGTSAAKSIGKSALIVSQGLIRSGKASGGTYRGGGAGRGH